MAEKSNRQLDRDEFRPPGEATVVSDHHLEQDHDSRDHLESREYPGRPEPASATCRGCGGVIPPGRSKCASCLREHVEPLDADAETPAVEWEFQRLVVAVVEASSDYAAIAKGAAACTLISRCTTEQIDRCQLVYDFDEPPSAFLTERWGDLPAVTRADSDAGRGLLATARQRTTRGRENDADRDRTTYLYDEAGDGVQTPDLFDTLERNTTDPIWLVPALGLQRVSHSRRKPDRESSLSGPRRATLQCHRCEEHTPHSFAGHDAVPDARVPDVPIWTCDACGMPRHGPGLEIDG